MNVLDKIKELNLTDDELLKLESELRQNRREKEIKQTIDRIIENRKYLGKCYFDKNKNQYICVLSSKSTNEFRAECLVFEYPIRFIEVHKALGLCDARVNSRIDFGGLSIDSYPLTCYTLVNGMNVEQVETLKPITLAEYFNILDLYIKDLKNMIISKKFDTSVDISQHCLDNGSVIKNEDTEENIL
ncbi:MAG: hypothetical protein IJ593_11285 [Lachnospiraceae bacterium]|nr:hypothetical protein [Lachnospiraceae bacterium]